MFLDEMADDFSIGFRFELFPPVLQQFFELQIIFDDAIMNQHHAARPMGMSIVFGRFAMGGPARVPDTQMTNGSFVGDFFNQIIELSFSPLDGKVTPVFYSNTR